MSEREKRLAELHAAWMCGDNEDSWAVRIVELEERAEQAERALAAKEAAYDVSVAHLRATLARAEERSQNDHRIRKATEAELMATRTERDGLRAALEYVRDTHSDDVNWYRVNAALRL